MLTPGMDPNEAYRIASQNGLSVEQAAQQMGYSVADVNQWLASNNLQAPSAAPSASYQPPEPAWQQKPGGTINASTDPMEAYRIAMRNGMSYGDVARQMGVGVNDVSQWLTDNKLPYYPGFLAAVINNVNQQGYDLDQVAPTLWQSAFGKTIEEISLETGYSPQEIAEYMRRNNLGPTAPGIKEYYSGLTKAVPGGGSPMLDNANRPTGAWNGTGVLGPDAYINQYGGQFGWSAVELAKMRGGFANGAPPTGGLGAFTPTQPGSGFNPAQPSPYLPPVSSFNPAQPSPYLPPVSSFNPGAGTYNPIQQPGSGATPGTGVGNSPTGPSPTSPIATPTPTHNGGDIIANGVSYSWLGNNLWMDGMGQTHYFDRNLARNYLGPEAERFYPSPLAQVGSI